MTFCAILSISLIVNLPGLAVTPMLGSLSKIFPDTTQLEKQLLTLLPNLAIIPFVFLSGKLSLSRHKTGVIVTALLIFTACSIAYLFADSMVWLIVVSLHSGMWSRSDNPFFQRSYLRHIRREIPHGQNGTRLRNIKFFISDRHVCRWLAKPRQLASPLHRLSGMHGATRAILLVRGKFLKMNLYRNR